MIYPEPGSTGLDITTASVTMDPALASADPAMMATAARAFATAAHQVHGAGQASSKASAQLSTYWVGKGWQGFNAASTKANSAAQVSGAALANASGALMNLSSQIAAAKALAQKAQTMAANTVTAAGRLQSAYAESSRQAVQNLPPHATYLDVLAARSPTAGQVAQANAISGEATQAIGLMKQANTMARQAWDQAAGAFEAVTAQAPSVQQAVASASAKAAAANSHHGGGFWSGLGKLAGAVILPIGAGAADFFSDGAAAAATPEEGAAEDGLVTSGIADLTGGSAASASEIATAEEQAAAGAEVDGTPIGKDVADDAAGDMKGVDRGDGRDYQGKFANGASGQGKDYEAQGIQEYEQETGNPVITDQVQASQPGTTQTRFYDGLVENSDGTYTGIEVKSGSAIGKYSGSDQEAFDNRVNAGTPTTAKLNGQTITITRVILRTVNP